MNELGNLLRKLRGKESLRTVSKRSGVSYTHIRNIEKNFDPRSGSQVRPSPDTLKMLADAYNYPYEELMKLIGYSTSEDEKYLKLAKQLIELQSRTKNIELKDLKKIQLTLDGKPIPEHHKQAAISMLISLHKELNKELPDTDS